MRVLLINFFHDVINYLMKMIKLPLLVKISSSIHTKIFHRLPSDDYRLTACISFLKLIHNRCKGVIEPDMNSILAMSSDKPNEPAVVHDEEPILTRSLTLPPGQLLPKPANNGKNTSTKKVPLSAIEFALTKATDFVLSREHEDIDINQSTQAESTDEQWTQFIEQFYAASQ
jgi:hypothetical protein